MFSKNKSGKIDLCYLAIPENTRDDTISLRILSFSISGPLPISLCLCKQPPFSPIIFPCIYSLNHPPCFFTEIHSLPHTHTLNNHVTPFHPISNSSRKVLLLVWRIFHSVFHSVFTPLKICFQSYLRLDLRHNISRVIS